jgi:predicted nucleic acid-binding protein
MTARRFVDTNIPLYAVSARPDDRTKSQTARAILESGDICTSVQVLQEFFVQATHPLRPDRIPHEEAIRFIQALCEFPVQEITVGLLLLAAGTKQRFQISYWDAAVIEAARALGCKNVLSEDLNDRQDYGGITVVNPFRRSARVR